MTRVITIDDPTHEALKPYMAVRERDLIGREGLFIAEGEVVVRVLVERSPLKVRSLLLEARRVEPMRDVIEGLAADVVTYVVSQAIMDAIVGFSIHRGVLALGERGAPIDPKTLVSSANGLDGTHSSRERTLVALVGLTNHDNVGSIFRNAAAFGAHGVLLDDETCDPLYRKSIRVSAGTALVVPFARCGSAMDMLDLLQAANIEPIALTPRGEETIDRLEPRPRAIVLGTEGPGLPPEVLARARRVRIDMAPGLDSLNVAVASGIALHEVTRSLRSPATLRDEDTER